MLRFVAMSHNLKEKHWQKILWIVFASVFCDENNYLCTYDLYTAPCIMFWMRAYPFRGEVGRGRALEFSSFLGPVKW
jgi:hypothetical protein